MNNKITLSPFNTRSHKALLERWLFKDHVSRWWLNPADRLAECLESPAGGDHALIVCDSRPIGYIRWRMLNDEEHLKIKRIEHRRRAMDIDLFIGEEEYTGRGIGPAAIEMLIERLSREGSAGIAGLGASIKNKNAIKAFEKAGFRKFQKFSDPVYGTGRLLIREIGEKSSSQRSNHMEKQSFTKRFLYPVLLVFTVMAVSWAGYFGSRTLDSDLLHQLLAKVFGTSYFLSVAFGTLYVYTVSYIRGAPIGERILASLVNPFIWMTKECIRLFASYNVLQCLYYYFNPLNFWLLCFMVFEMGLASMIARRILKSRGDSASVITRGSLATVLVSISVVIAAYAWGKGENLYVIFLAGFRVFFGSGI